MREWETVYTEAVKLKLSEISKEKPQFNFISTIQIIDYIVILILKNNLYIIEDFLTVYLILVKLKH